MYSVNYCMDLIIQKNYNNYDQILQCSAACVFLDYACMCIRKYSSTFYIGTS